MCKLSTATAIVLLVSLTWLPSLTASSPQPTAAHSKVSWRLKEAMQSSLPDSVMPVIVVLEPSKTKSESTQEAQSHIAGYIASIGGEVERRFHLINAISAKIPAKAVDMLAERREVKRIYLDEKITITPPLGRGYTRDAVQSWLSWRQSKESRAGNSIVYRSFKQPIPGGNRIQQGSPVYFSWGVGRINAPACWDAGITGSGVIVGVVDSGIDGSHPALSGKVLASIDFTWEQDGIDHVGHGTAVAGVIAGKGGTIGDPPGEYRGVAPDALLLAAKVFDSSGSGFTSWVMAGIEWCVDNGADVINFSGGRIALSDMDTDPLNMIANAAWEYGVTVVVAAGNSGPGYGSIEIPASASQVIAVGSVNRDDEISGFSSRGPTVDGRVKPEVVAPGEEIVAPALGGGWDTWYGTSFSTPMVSGIVALALQVYAVSPDEVKNRIMELTQARLSGLSPFIQGNGLADAEAAVLGQPAIEFLKPQVSFGVAASLKVDTTYEQKIYLRNNLDSAVIVTMRVEEVSSSNIRVEFDPSSFRIRAHEIREVTIRVEPLKPGYYGGYIVASFPGGGSFIPFSVRAGLPDGGGSFSGVLKYGVYESGEGDLSYHAFTVPTGVGGYAEVTVSGPRGTDIDLYLIAPDGEVVAASISPSPSERVLLDLSWTNPNIRESTWVIAVHAWDLGGFEQASYRGKLTFISSVSSPVIAEAPSLLSGCIAVVGAWYSRSWHPPAATVDVAGATLIASFMSRMTESTVIDVAFDDEVVNLTTGGWIDSSSNLLAVGGPAVNAVSAKAASMAGISWSIEDSNITILIDGAGSFTYTPDMERHRDYVIVHILKDGDRYIMAVWGISPWGTLAGSYYLSYGLYYGYLYSLRYELIVVEWIDENGNMRPDPYDSYEVIATR